MDNKIVFSHRPVLGVSVGAFSENGRLFVAFSFTNDGTSRNGIFHADRRDEFCRNRARMIITGRINKMRQSSGHFVADEAGTLFEQPTEVKFGLNFKTDISAAVFMNAFRETFKPTTDESDEYLCVMMPFSDYEDPDPMLVRCRMFASDMHDVLVALTQNIIDGVNTNASTSV